MINEEKKNDLLISKNILYIILFFSMYNLFSKTLSPPPHIGLYMVWCSRFLWPFLHRTGIFSFLKTQAIAVPEERFSGNIGGSSSRHGGRCPPIYHTHTQEERSKTQIKPRKLKDSNHKSKLRSNLNIKRFKTHYKPKY